MTNDILMYLVEWSGTVNREKKEYYNAETLHELCDQISELRIS